MAFDGEKITEWTNDAHNGNGCILGEKLSLLSLTDRVKALGQIDNQAKQDVADRKSGNSVSLNLQDRSAHMELFSQTPKSSSNSIYHEDFQIVSNSSAVTCADMHYEQQGRAPTTKRYNLTY